MTNTTLHQIKVRLFFDISGHLLEFEATRQFSTPLHPGYIIRTILHITALDCIQVKVQGDIVLNTSAHADPDRVNYTGQQLYARTFKKGLEVLAKSSTLRIAKQNFVDAMTSQGWIIEEKK